MKALERFLTETKLHREFFDLPGLVALFHKEMAAGLCGEPSSLQMLPSYIGDSLGVAEGEKVGVVDAGGTNLRISRVAVTGKGTVIERTKKVPVPGAGTPVSVEAFFDVIALSLREIAGEARKVGFCFSFPVEVLPDRDGRVLSLNKEVVVEGIVGERIGIQLNRACRRLGLPAFGEVAVVNDTTAALLGGRGACEGNFSSYVGLVLGTGYNCCYYEENGNITKSPALCGASGRTIVNMESGFFDKMPRGAVDDAFCAGTMQPEDSLLEKMTGGQYLGPLCAAFLGAAKEAGLFTPQGARALGGVGTMETKEVNRLLEGKAFLPLSGLAGHDREVAACLTGAVYERAARLAAANVAACVLRSGRRDAPVLVTVEGTTYYRSPVLRQGIEEHLTAFLEGEGFPCQLARVEDGVTHGTALAAGMR